MNLRLNILFIFTFLSSVCFAQGTLPTTCVKSKARYKVSALPGSTIVWNVSGGTVIKDYNDSIDIQWGNVSGNNFYLSYREINSFGCSSTVETDNIVINSPYVDLGTAKTICEGDSTTLDASGTFTKYLWNNGSTLSSYIASKPGIYWVEVTDNAGCIFRDTIAISVNSNPKVTLEKNIAVCAPATHRFDATTTNATNYLWFNGGTGSSYEAIEGDSLIWVKVSDDNGCAGYDTTTLIACNLASKIPNAFTPNGDNDNDVWRLDLIKAQYPNLVVKIYDRWGRLVFISSRGYGSPWDGSSKGKPLPMDTYYYVVDFGNGAKELVGSVAIIR